MRIALIVACLSMTVLLQACVTPAEPPATDLPRVDANGDGIVTRAEAGAYPRLATHFDAADTNRDGRLEGAEVDAGRELARREARSAIRERWAAADKDGDGAISQAEANESLPRLAKRFGEFDANGDGKISRDELHGFVLEP
ncbi:MAG TPA: EF-hand domain-containing protein [Steroidobacteraceae bacterium]|nr:EF-hand domain-containing protein [Steroidobacteraceae bacterium]